MACYEVAVFHHMFSYKQLTKHAKPGSLLGWLQWVEKAEHAFISNPLLLA